MRELKHLNVWFNSGFLKRCMNQKNLSADDVERISRYYHEKKIIPTYLLADDIERLLQGFSESAHTMANITYSDLCAFAGVFFERKENFLMIGRCA